VSKKRILIVDDDLAFSTIIQNLMEMEGYKTEVAHCGADALSLYQRRSFDLVLLDLFLGEESGLDLLRRLQADKREVPIIVMTAFGSMETVAEALRENAFDYVTKPFRTEEILNLIKRALERQPLSDQPSDAEAPARSFPSIVGKSAAMIDVYKAIARVSKTDATVLITGESGTGKELVARAIHDNSSRRAKPFIAVNCGAFTETLLESELFGHVRGAFTGATAAHRGLFDSASGGTIFLDEITETLPSFQVRLLRVLQERAIRPVGAGEEKPVDVRILAATNRPLPELFDAKEFRKDLLYRLSVINIHLPALRERREDIPLLVDYFLHRFSSQQKKPAVVPRATLDWLVSLPWQGNVRELENAMERAVAMNVSGRLLPADFTQFGLITKAESAPRAAATAPPEVGSDSAWLCPVPSTLDEVERSHILATLRHTRGNKLRAAELLGIGRWSLYRMAQRLGIDLNNLSADEDSAKPE
jgi:DNA-binding NtrC family response regulator